MKQIPVINIALLTLGNVGLYVNTSGILLLCIFAFSSRSFFLSKVLVFSIPLFISCSLYPLSINLLCNLSQLSWNSLFVEQIRRRRKACEKVCFVLKTQDVLIYDVNKPVDRILSCRAWFPVYLIVFYKRQNQRNLSLY